MKKLLFLGLLLAMGGFAYWFLHPNQQLKRKTNRILSTYTVEPGSSAAGSAVGSLTIDTLFNKSVELDVQHVLTKWLGYLKSPSVSRDSLTSAKTNMTSIIKALTHETSNMKVKSTGNDSYDVTFEHTITGESKGMGKLRYKKTENMTTTFSYNKAEGSFKVYKIIIR